MRRIPCFNVKLESIGALALRQLYLFRRSSARVLSVFYGATMGLFTWGIITQYFYESGGGEFNFLTALLGAVILWHSLTQVQQGITISFLEDVWSRNFINLFVTPLSIKEYITGILLTSFMATTAALALMTIMAYSLFAYNILQFGLLLVPFIGILAVFGTAIGVITVAAILRFGHQMQVLAWSVPALLMPFSAVFYPVESLPEILQPIARALPPSHIFEGMREIALAGYFNSRRLLTAATLSLLYLGASIWITHLAFKIARRDGSLTKLMAK